MELDCSKLCQIIIHKWFIKDIKNNIFLDNVANIWNGGFEWRLEYFVFLFRDQ